MSDPYVYPGTHVLKNKFDITDFDALQDLEAILYYHKMTLPIPEGNFDYQHLKAIHKHFFSDLYSWAGEERTVDIAKGDSYFAASPFINSEAIKLFNKLKDDNFICELGHQEFCTKLSYYFNEINAIHPFREGNGRTQRSFCKMLSENAGYELDWKLVTVDDYIRASIQGFNGRYDPMKQAFLNITFPQQRSQDHAIIHENLSEKALSVIYNYIDNQATLTELITQKNIYLVKDPMIANQYALDALALDKKITELANIIVKDESVQQLSITNDKLNNSKRKQATFQDIHMRKADGNMTLHDIVTTVKHAEGKIAGVTKSLSRDQNIGGRIR